MAKREIKSKLPKGITYRENKDLYMWRFQHNGTPYCGYCKTLTEAKEALEDMKYEVKHGMKGKEKKDTLDAWFEEWLDTYKSGCKESTLNFYRNVYRRYISPVFGKSKVKDLKTTQIQRFTNHMAKNYSKTTASTVNFLLFDCLKQAKQLHMINANPMSDTSVPRFKPQERKKALTSEQVMQFMDYAKANKCSYYPIYRMLSLTGCRIGEILGLEWDNVDFDAESIYIKQTLIYMPSTGFYFDEPKSDAGKRRIRMKKGGELYNLLKARRVEQLEQRLKAHGYWKPLKGFENLVFTTEVGTPHHDTNVRKRMKVLIERMREQGYDIPDFTPHTLRHCYATRALENGMQPKTLQKVLGHSTFQTTMDLYADCMDSTINDEMDMIAKAL